MNFQFGGGSSKGVSLFGQIFLCLFATPFFGFGLFAAWSGVKKLLAGDTGQGLGACAFGLVFAGAGLGMMFFAITAGRRQRLVEQQWSAQTDGGAKPWLVREDWAAGKIKSAASAQWKVFLFMGLGFCFIGGVSSVLALPQELPKGNYLALLVLLFPLIGLGLLGEVIRSFQAQRRFGDCWFELAQVPAPVGGSLDGLIQTGKPVRLEQGLQLRLSCVRRTTSGSGDNRSTTESILWQDEKFFRAEAALPATGAGGSGIPVHFDLPTDQPETLLRGNPTIHWRLEARAKMAGPDFTAVFEVPVFRVAGFLPSASREVDPTESLQKSVEEIRRDEHSRIQVKPVPDGMEFYFPAARNLGTVAGITGFFLIWTLFTAVLFWRINDLLFEVIFGGVDVILLICCVNLWLKSSRVKVNRDGVSVVSRWLLVGRTRQFGVDEADQFEVTEGMTSGSKVFYNLKLSRRNGRRGVTVAGSIPSKPEAQWLAREMNRALGRK